METFITVLIAVTGALALFGLARAIAYPISRVVKSPSISAPQAKTVSTLFMYSIWLVAGGRLLEVEEWTLSRYVDLAFVIILPICTVFQIRQWQSDNAGAEDKSAATTNAQPAQLDDATLTDINRLLSQSQKIEAIKLYREATGAGLKDSKEFVEALEAEVSAS